MSETINKFIFDINGEEYEFAGGGGGQPGPDTVGTKEIQNDSIEMEDLNQKVKDKMVTDDDRVTQDEIDGFEV